MSERVAVIGAGSWGTALAKVLAEKGHDVLVWAYEPEVARGINEGSRNPLFLPKIHLPENIRATDDLAKAVRGRGSWSRSSHRISCAAYGRSSPRMWVAMRRW